MNNWRKYILIILALIVILTAFIIYKRTRVNVGQIPAAEVNYGNFKITLQETGTLEALNSHGIYPDGWGISIDDIVPEGTYVKEGDFLVRFKDDNEEDWLERREDELEQANKNYEQAQYTYELEQLNFEMDSLQAEKKLRDAQLEARRKELSNISPLEKENAKKNLELAKAEYKQFQESQRIKIEQSKAKLEQAKLTLKSSEDKIESYKKEVEKQTIYSPSDGLVIYGEFRGEKIQKGTTVWRSVKVIELPDLSKMIAKTEVNEVDVGRVEVGQKTNVKLDAFPELTFTGGIMTISNLATKSKGNTGAQVFTVDVLLDESDEQKMKPGMTANVEIIIQEIPDVFYIPREAIFQKQDTTVVYVKNLGSYDMKKVKLGKNNSNFVVIEKGLQEGDVVFLRDPTIKIEEIGEGKEGSNGKK